jgi:hypothetical protein
VRIPDPKVKKGTTGIFEFLESCAKKIKNIKLKYSKLVILVGRSPLVMNLL